MGQSLVKTAPLCSSLLQQGWLKGCGLEHVKVHSLHLPADASLGWDLRRGCQSEHLHGLLPSAGAWAHAGGWVPKESLGRGRGRAQT